MRVGKAISFLMVAILISASFAPIAIARNSFFDLFHSSKAKFTGKSPFKEKLVKFVERLVERFPSLANIPLIKRILEGSDEQKDQSEEEESQGTSNDTSSGQNGSAGQTEQNETGKRYADETQENDNNETTNTSGREEEGSQDTSNDTSSGQNESEETNDTEGEESTEDTNNEPAQTEQNQAGSNKEESQDTLSNTFSLGGQEEETIPLSSNSSEQNGLKETSSKNPFLNYTSGHITITGNITIKLTNEVLEIKNHTIILSGTFYLESKNDTVDIWWNVSDGFFKINGSRYFAIDKLYFDADGKIFVSLDRIVVDTGGCIAVDRSNKEGLFMFDGIRELRNLSVNVHLEEENITLKCSLDFSGDWRGRDFILSWSDEGIFANGSFAGNGYLLVDGFTFIYDNFTVDADTIRFYSNASIVFNEIENGTVVCSILSPYLTATGLYIEFKGASLYLGSVAVHGFLKLNLEVSSAEFITVEGRHVIITGNTVMNLNSTLDVNGTIIRIFGKVMVGQETDRVDIWWNTSRGFLKIRCSSLTTFLNFGIYVNSSTYLFVKIGKLVMRGGGYVIIDKVNGTAHLTMNRCLDLYQLSLSGSYNGKLGSLSIGSIHIDAKGRIDIHWNKETREVSINASTRRNFIMHDIRVGAGDILLEISTVSLHGNWILRYNDSQLFIKVKGSIKIVGFSAKNAHEGAAVTLVHIGYIEAHGTVRVLIRGGIIEIWLSGDGSISIGASPAGPIYISGAGRLHAVIDLTTGEAYGEFGFGAFLSVMGIGIIISGEGHFYFADGELQVWIEGSFFTSLGLIYSVRIDNLTIGACIYADVYGRYELYIRVNFITGDMSIAGGIGGVAIISISHISAYGENVNLDENDWEKLGIDEDSILYSLRFHIGLLDLDTGGAIRVKVIFSIGLNGGFGFCVGPIYGDLGWNLIIKDFKLSSNPDNPLINGINFSLGIDEIRANGRFKIEGEDLQDLLITFNGKGKIEDVTINVTSSRAGGFFNTSIDKINLEGSLDIELINLFHGLSPGLYWDTLIEAKASVFTKIEGISLNGKGYDMLGSNLTISGYIDSISIDIGGFVVKFDGSSNGTLTISGYGSVNIDDVGFDVSLNGFLNFDMESFVDDVNFSLDGSIVFYGNGTVSLESEASLEVNGISVNTTFGNLSIDLVSSDAAVSVYIYNNGTIDAKGNATLAMYNISIGNLTIDSFFASLEGSLTYHPGNESAGIMPSLDINGSARLDAEGDIEIHGNITTNATITIKIENNTDGNLTLVDIKFDGKVSTNISIDGYCEWLGNFSLSLQNYTGEGMFEFYWNLTKGELYMGNFINATWDIFNFSIFDGKINGDIYYFMGDLTLSNFSANRTLLREWYQRLKEFYQGNWSLSGNLDPDNWTIHSEKGYETLLGFDFSSETSLDMEGDVHLGRLLEVNKLYCEPGTKGRFEVNVDEKGNFNITFVCYSGYAEVDFTVNILGVEWEFHLRSDEEYVELPIGDLLRFIDDLKDGEWEEVWDDLPAFLDAINKFADLGETALLELIKAKLQQIIDEGNIPDWLKELLEEIIKEIEEINGEKKEQSCFLAGTKIAMADGSLKDIEDIRVGDLVKSYDVKEKKWKVGVVTKVYHHPAKGMADYYIVINRDLRVTPNHPVYLNGKWVNAEELKVGDTFGGNVITSLEKIYRKVPTYNIEVEPYHTYCVVWGNGAFSLVHNARKNATAVVIENVTVISDKLLNEIINETEEHQDEHIDSFCCVAEGTEVTMQDGSTKPIESIEYGSYVLSYDLERHCFTRSKVIGVYTPTREGLYEINGGFLSITDDHPLYVKKPNGRTGWAAIDPLHASISYQMEVMQLELGDRVLTEDGTWVTIYSIKYKPGNVKTYTLELSSPYNTFFANAVLVKGCSVKADAGMKTEVNISKGVIKKNVKKVTLSKVIKVVPKTYFNKKGKEVKLDNYRIVVDDKGSYEVKKEKNGKLVTVKKNLRSAKEVINYIQNSIVNGGGSNGGDNKDHEDDDTCCFPAGTLITMADGSKKPVEKVKVGESVLSYDTSKGKFVVCKVLEIVSPIRKGVYEINDGLIRVTDDHPFYVLKRDDRKGWASIKPEKTEEGYGMKVMPLEIGDKIFSEDGKWITVYSIRYIPGSIRTYNLEDVSGKSTFFANGLLVHNAKQCKKVSQTNDNNEESDNDSEESESSRIGITSCDVQSVTELENGSVLIEIPIEFNGSGSYIEKQRSATIISGILPSTKITMADGTEKIVSALRKGDKVKTFSQHGLTSTSVENIVRYSSSETGSYYMLIKFRPLDYNKNYQEIDPYYPERPYQRDPYLVREFSPMYYNSPYRVTDVADTSRKNSQGTTIKELKVTPGCLVYVKRSSWTWIPASGLRRGDKLLGSDGSIYVIVSVERVYSKKEAYSLELNENKPFFANGVLVKNINPRNENNRIIKYIWLFGDGSIGYGKEALHLYRVRIPVKEMDQSPTSSYSEITRSAGFPKEHVVPGKDEPIKTPEGNGNPASPKVGNPSTRTPRKAKDPLVPKIDEPVKTPTDDIMPEYMVKTFKYRVRLLAVDKYGNIGVDVTDIAVKVPIPIDMVSRGEMGGVSFKRIEDIKAGDVVKAFDFKSRKLVDAKVTEVEYHLPKDMGSYYLSITFASERGFNQKVKLPETSTGDHIPYHVKDYTQFSLKVTPDHPICVIRSSLDATNSPYRWIPASSLKEGDIVATLSFGLARVVSIEKIYQKVPTYNIKVERYGNYFANGILVGDKSSVAETSTCFLAGTLVAIPRGGEEKHATKEEKDQASISYKDIEDIKIGDTVLALNLQTGEKVTAKVTGIEKHSSSEMGAYYLAITFSPFKNVKTKGIYVEDATESPNAITLKVTPNHPICKVTFTSKLSPTYAWVPAGSLRVGDTVYSLNGLLKVTSIKKVYEKVEMYNIKVEGYGNYFANGILVSDKGNTKSSTCFPAGTKIAVVETARMEGSRVPLSRYTISFVAF